MSNLRWSIRHLIAIGAITLTIGLFSGAAFIASAHHEDSHAAIFATEESARPNKSITARNVLLVHGAWADECKQWPQTD